VIFLRTQIFVIATINDVMWGWLSQSREVVAAESRRQMARGNGGEPSNLGMQHFSGNIIFEEFFRNKKETRKSLLFSNVGQGSI
jgi:hypothetical protein